MKRFASINIQTTVQRKIQQQSNTTRQLSIPSLQFYIFINNRYGTKNRCVWSLKHYGKHLSLNHALSSMPLDSASFSFCFWQKNKSSIQNTENVKRRLTNITQEIKNPQTNCTYCSLGHLTITIQRQIKVFGLEKNLSLLMK